MAVQLSIPVADSDSLISLGHDCVEIWQSTDDGDTYHRVTDVAAKAAEIKSAKAVTTFVMGNCLLKFILDGGVERSIQFDPLLQYWTPAQVVSTINSVVPGAAILEDDCVVLRSPTTGRASSVEVTYSDSPNLGFKAGTKIYGLNGHVPLVTGTYIYFHSDVVGPVGSRYRWRFSNSGANPISDFSNYVLGTAGPALDASKVSVCSARFVGVDGVPVKTKIVVGMDQGPTSSGALTIVGNQTRVFESGDDGFLIFTLTRNTKVRVAIEGTYLVREIVVPNAPYFDLLAALSTATDPFTVQSVPPYLIRRNL